MAGTTAERLAERLVSFLRELPEDERALLLVVLADRESDEEVSGYDLQTAWSSLSASAPSGGGQPSATDSRMLTMITQILEMQHEGKKSVIQNLRA